MNQENVLRRLREYILKYRVLEIGILIGVCFLIYGISVPKRFLGDVFFDSKFVHNPVLAEFFYRQSLRFDTTVDGKPEPYIYYQLGRIYFVEGDFDAAYRAFEKELEIYPDNTNTYYMLGLLYGYDHEEEKAIEAFKKFIAYKPTTWAGRNDMAWLQFRIGDVDGALKTILPVVSIIPPNPWVLNTYGVLVMNKGDYRGAAEVFTDAYTAASAMTEADWGNGYPGNDPRVYAEGLEAMRASILKNRALAESKNTSSDVDNKK